MAKRHSTQQQFNMDNRKQVCPKPNYGKKDHTNSKLLTKLQTEAHRTTIKCAFKHKAKQHAQTPNYTYKNIKQSSGKTRQEPNSKTAQRQHKSASVQRPKYLENKSAAKPATRGCIQKQNLMSEARTGHLRQSKNTCNAKAEHACITARGIKH